MADKGNRRTRGGSHAHTPGWGRSFALLLALFSLFAVLPAVASAASPWWQITTGSEPTNLAPGGSGTLVLTVLNLGDANASGATTPITIADALPPGIAALDVRGYAGARAHQEANVTGNVPCTLESTSSVSCSFTGELPYSLKLSHGLP